MKTILKTLVETPSVTNDKAAINSAIEYIDRYLSERGMHVKRFEINGIESIVATTHKTKTPKVMLAAHVDVVPASKEQFTFREIDGRYYGRGVFDMKCAIAAYLQLVEDLNGSLTDYDFGLMITSDEEVGGTNGVKALIEEGYLPSVAILPDAGDTPDSWKFERSAKGRIALTVKTFGKSAHGSRPWKGENAIDKLTVLLGEIRALFKDQGPQTSTLTVTTIKGGEAYNQVPASASAELDIRTISNKDIVSIDQKLRKLCEKYNAELSEDTVSRVHSIKIDKYNPQVVQFFDSFRQAVPNDKLVEQDSHGGSDARHFEAVGIPCIVIGPPGDGYHAADEWVSKEGLNQLLDVLHLYLEQTAKLPVAQTVDAAAATV